MNNEKRVELASTVLSGMLSNRFPETEEDIDSAARVAVRYVKLLESIVEEEEYE